MYDMNQNCIEIFCVLEKYLKLILRSVTIQSTRLNISIQFTSKGFMK